MIQGIPIRCRILRHWHSVSVYVLEIFSKTKTKKNEDEGDNTKTLAFLFDYFPCLLDYFCNCFFKLSDLNEIRNETDYMFTCWYSTIDLVNCGFENQALLALFIFTSTVESQWLELLWNHKNMFKYLWNYKNMFKYLWNHKNMFKYLWNHKNMFETGVV